MEEQGQKLKAELTKLAFEVPGVGKHWQMKESVKVEVETTNRDKEIIIRILSINKLFTNCFESTQGASIPWWCVKGYKIL